MEIVSTVVPGGRSGRESQWLNGARWDLVWLIGSAIVVPLSLLPVWAGISSDLMNLAVTLLVGGPHVFSTLLVTYLDTRYRRQHGVALFLVAIGVLTFVVWMTLAHFQILMSFFVFAASFHVLHQSAFLSDLYRSRAPWREHLVSRLLDYAVLFLSFYPVASYKLVHDDFRLGEIQILIPSLVKEEWTWKLIAGLFGVAVLLWVGKTLRERRQGTLNVPKTALIALTSGIAFLVPLAATGSRLELAFQTVNVWHSLQYLGLIWLVLAVQKREGRALPPMLSALAGPGRAACWFYGACVGFTALLLGIVFLLHRTDPLELSTAQYYYMSIFGVLFIHYAFDGYFFLVSGRGGADPRRAPLALLQGTKP
jgi:hypothetical protein